MCLNGAGQVLFKFFVEKEWPQWLKSAELEPE